jgi:hypothetical protein
MRVFLENPLFVLNHGFGETRDIHNASKECFWPNFFLNFMQGFKSAILAIFHFWQNGTFESLHEIQNHFWPKAFF